VYRDTIVMLRKAYPLEISDTWTNFFTLLMVGQWLASNELTAMRSTLRPLAPLLEPDSLSHDDGNLPGGGPEPRQMIARVTVADRAQGMPAFYVALLEESPTGAVLSVTELGAARIVSDFVRVEGIEFGASTYEELSGDRTIRVAWREGTAVEYSSLRRPSVA
jgi:hypothetical protein